MNVKKLVVLGMFVGVLAMVMSSCASNRYGHKDYYAFDSCGGAAQCGPGFARTTGDWMSRDVAAMTTPPPADAKPGECFARVYVPPQYETTTERVLVREASERVETIPAKYEVVDDRVMVKEPSKRLEEIPAKYEWTDEKVLIEESHTEWRPGRGDIERMDSATGEILCLVEVPASYKTVRKQVLVSPATVHEVDVPAEYQMIKVTKMVSPPQEKRIPMPAEYQTVTKTHKVSEGHSEWKRVQCETDQSRPAEQPSAAH
jgi:hypothetical protein